MCLWLICVIFVICLLLLVRFMYIEMLIFKQKSFPVRRKYNKVKTLIVIGSGGHTTEILRVVKELNSELYSPRIYVMASSDSSSESKICTVEEYFQADTKKKQDYEIIKIPRSRHVNQSYLTSVLTTINSSIFCLPLILRTKPDLLLCNGPGTCVPLCIIAFVMKLLFLANTHIVYIESICRVKSLSLSGKILMYFADELFVQWPDLKERYKRTKYIGRLV